MQSDPSKMLSAIFTLSPLTSELPVIQAPQGRFVPLRELCELVGLRPSAYIGVFCRSFRPRQAIQKLPRQTPLGQQEVWCLEQKWLPLWLVKLPVSRLPPDRREQLMILQETCNVALGWAHQKLLHRQESVRRYAFRILSVCEQHESWLQDWEEQGLLLFPPALHQELAARLIQGHRLGEALATAARRTLRDVLEGPVVDGQLFYGW